MSNSTHFGETVSAAHRTQQSGDIAPFCLLRIATLPYEMLAALRLTVTGQRLNTILSAEANMEAQRQPLEDALHQLVPGIAPDDANFRRTVLALRRDIHNGRPSRLKTTQFDAIAQRLPAAAAAQLRQWQNSQVRLAQANAELEPGLREEIRQALRPALRAPLAIGTFRRGLAFASSGVAHSAMSESRLPNPPRPNNLERSLLGYLNRAAAKTSPFSSFMALSVVGVEPQAELPYPCVKGAEYLSRTNLNRGIFSRLYRAGITEAARYGDIELKLNPTFAPSVAGRMQALCDREAVLLGRPWLEQRLAQFRLDGRIVAVLTSVPASDTHAGWCERLVAAGFSAEQVEPLLAKLLERGVLLPPPLLDAFDEAPQQTLAYHWCGSRSPLLRRQVPLLDSMVAAADEIASVEGESRSQAFEHIRCTETEVLQALDGGQAEPLQNMVLEDCWLIGLRGSMGGNLLQPLPDLQRFLSGQVIVSPYYQRLRDHFLREFGSGGECTDLVGFLLRVGDKLVDIPEFGAEPKELPMESAPAGAAIPVTTQLQIAAGPNLPQPLMVVNRVFDGVGWLAARYASGEQAEQRLLRDKLSQWLRHVYQPREPVDLVLSGQCNDLQAHAPLTRRALQWPGEPLLTVPEQRLDARAVKLIHNTDSGLLELFDERGAPISLVYLGATFPSPIWGVRYALSILTQPYLLRRPAFRPPPGRNASEITFEARLTQGALVLRRATWWLSTTYLEREWFTGTEAERLLKVKRDCQRHIIPEVVFARRYIAPERRGLIPVDVLNANRKPLWVNLCNPFWLHMLERLAKGGDWIFLSEPLPDADGLWLQVEGQRHVSEVQLEMIVRADPLAQSPAWGGKI